MGLLADHQLDAMKKTLPRRGFTLAEALVSMSILALLLGLAASIFVGYTRMTRQSTPHERNLVLGYTSLDRMRTEVASSIDLFQPLPANGATANVLGFEKVDPSVASRLPDPLVIPAAFEPLDPASNCQVRYEVLSGKLIRKAWGTSWTSEETLMGNVLGLTTTFEAPAGLQITLNLQEERTTRKLSATSYLWSRP